MLKLRRNHEDKFYGCIIMNNLKFVLYRYREPQNAHDDEDANEAESARKVSY